MCHKLFPHKLQNTQHTNAKEFIVISGSILRMIHCMEECTDYVTTVEFFKFVGANFCGFLNFYEFK
jgi:hypothetical protein